MSTRELQRRLVENLHEWQKLEDAQASLAGGALHKTDDPFLAVVMEMIQRDSQMHRRVQQLLIDSLESEVVAIDARSAQLLRDQLSEHLRLEKETLRLARENLAAVTDQGFPVQEFLLEFLRRDEQKHRDLMADLEAFVSSPEDAE